VCEQVRAVGREVRLLSTASHPTSTHMPYTVLTTKSAYVNAGPWERLIMSKRRASCSAEIFMPAQRRVAVQKAGKYGLCVLGSWVEMRVNTDIEKCTDKNSKARGC
jgi:hypothetical protein